MNIVDDQRDVQRAYVGGGVGVLVSGLVWLVTAAVLYRTDISTAFTTLFFGGFFIFPLAELVSRKVADRAPITKGNALSSLALESTIAMIAMLMAAFLIMPYRPDAVFPLAAIAVGTHYLAFKTLYGDRTFWVLGAAITVAGSLALFTGVVGSLTVTLLVAAVEILVGTLLLLRHRGGR